MPQVYMILGPSVLEAISDEDLEDLGQSLIRVTERVFGIQGKNDGACTVVKAETTINEAQIQVEVRYTAGEDEYHTGKPFDPSKKVQEKLADELISEVRHQLGEKFTVSAWIKPHYGSVFKSGA